ncbi:hypothetical protein F1880_006139 [Penicillium rolfsii]|nr:hypothetical protein F1880_006139 [Penicillium rolfsii]
MERFKIDSSQRPQKQKWLWYKEPRRECGNGPPFADGPGRGTNLQQNTPVERQGQTLRSELDESEKNVGW